MADEVLTSRDGAVLTITLNRPDVYNAINRAMHEGLAAALRDAADPAVRAVVLTGAGRGLLRGTGPPGVRVAARRRARGPRADLSPEHARDSRAREAGARGGERSGRRRGALAGMRLRRSHRVGRRELRSGVHRDRARAGCREHVVRPSASRLCPRIRMDGVEPAPERRRGARLGPRLGGGRGGRLRARVRRAGGAGTRRCRRGRSR